MPEFIYHDVVKDVITAARARVPRLLPSAIAEIGEFASDMVTRHEFVTGDDGIPLTAAGQNVEQWINAHVATRPHYEFPAAEIDASDDTWTKVDDKGNISLTAQGVRHKVLTNALGSAKAATTAMEAEAALYGTKFGSTKPGVKPDPDGKKPAADGDANNPFNPRKTYTSQEARENEIVKFIKRFGTKTAQTHANRYGVDLAGRVLRTKTR